MSVKKSYNRFFIIFQEEDKGFGVAIDKQPTGYTKIETRNGRCKITVYVQNLVKEKGPYICCLLDASKDPVVQAKLGEIKVDETGRGETWWEYREEDIAETGLPVDRFSVAAVVIEGQKILSPLAGYVGKERFEWKEKLSPRLRNEKAVPSEKKEQAPENVEQLNEEAKKFKEYEDNIKTEMEDIKEELPGKSEGKKGKKVQLDVKLEIDKEEKRDHSENELAENSSEDELENENINKAMNLKEDDMDDNSDIEDIQGSKDMGNFSYNSKPEMYEDECKHKCKHHDHHGGKSYAEMFHDVLKEYEEVKDLTDEIKGCRWWRIPYSDDIAVKDDRYYAYYCAVHHLKMTYPYLNYIKYFKKCGYSYFGIRYDKSGDIKFIMYGIEGANSNQEQPYMGMTGFVKWMKHKHRDTGMWIMYYNPYTGCIMVPKEKAKDNEGCKD